MYKNDAYEKLKELKEYYLMGAGGIEMLNGKWAVYIYDDELHIHGEHYCREAQDFIKKLCIEKYDYYGLHPNFSNILILKKRQFPSERIDIRERLELEIKKNEELNNFSTKLVSEIKEYQDEISQLKQGIEDYKQLYIAETENREMLSDAYVENHQLKQQLEKKYDLLESCMHNESIKQELESRMKGYERIKSLYEAEKEHNKVIEDSLYELNEKYKIVLKLKEIAVLTTDTLKISQLQVDLSNLNNDLFLCRNCNNYYIKESAVKDRIISYLKKVCISTIADSMTPDLLEKSIQRIRDEPV